MRVEPGTSPVARVTDRPAIQSVSPLHVSARAAPDKGSGSEIISSGNPVLSQLTAAERMAIAGQTGVELTPGGSVADRPGPPQPPLQLILRMAEQRLAQRQRAAGAEHAAQPAGQLAARPPAAEGVPPSAAEALSPSAAGPAGHVDLNL